MDTDARARSVPDEESPHALPHPDPVEVAEGATGGVSGEVVEALDQLRALAEAASAAALALVAECDRRALWGEDGATSTTAWLCGRYRLTWGTATEWVRVARALESLPRIRAAYREGRLSWDQVRPLARFATPGDDPEWAHRAPGMAPGELWREWDRRRELRPREVEEDRRLRYLRLGWDEDRRFLELEGLLAPEEGAALEAAVAKAAERVSPDREALDPAGARAADGLVAAATSAGRRSAAPTLVVHADAEAVVGTDDGAPGDVARGGKRNGEGVGVGHARPPLGETEAGTRLPREAVRRLACDARVEWVVEAGGRPVGVGRSGRRIPPWLERLVRHRDRGACRFPGCGRRGFVRRHHIWHWVDGGPTDLDNLVTLCHFHHRLVHEGGWRIAGDPAGELTFHRPEGTALGREPPALRPEVRDKFFP